VNYYNRRIQQLNKELYGKDYITRQVIQAKHFIDKHFSDRIDLDKIAREAHLSKFHFVRLFKTTYGRTPHQYLIEKRMEKAKEFLKKGLSVSDVCISIGFESIPSFTRIFKKIKGTTPARFQQLKRKSNFG
jgi:AraC-like DNA-binding protein